MAVTTASLCTKGQAYTGFRTQDDESADPGDRAQFSGQSIDDAGTTGPTPQVYCNAAALPPFDLVHFGP